TAAAEAWKDDRTTCRAQNGAVVHEPSGRRLPYGKLATRAARLAVPTDAPLKDPKNFRLLGRRVPRLDTPSKVDGSATFGIDVTVPGMLVASIERCPARGSRVRGAVPPPRHHGANELHGARARRRLRRVGAHPEPDAGAGSHRRTRRPAQGDGPDSHDVPRGRIRPATRAGLRVGGGARVAGGRRAGESDLDARGRRAAWFLPPRQP